MIQRTDGRAKKMLLTHQKRRIRNGLYSLLEINGRWDPQTKSGKLCGPGRLGDYVTVGVGGEFYLKASGEGD